MTELSGKTEPPLITVITPFYNNGSTVNRALDSLFAQTYDNVQFVFVDDGSESFDAEAVQQYIETHKSEGIREYSILWNEHNLGTVKALNKCLAVAKGEYIFSLSADDCFYDAEVLSDWVAEFLKTGADVLTAKRAVYDQDLENYLFSAPSEREMRWIKKSSPQKLLEKMSGANLAFGACTAYSRKCYEITGGKLDERFRLIEDFPLNLKLLHAGIPIRFFDRVVIRYRWGGVSNFDKVNAGYLEESDNIFKLVSLPLVRRKLHARFAYSHWKRGIELAKVEFGLRRRFRADIKRSGKFLARFIMLLRHPFYMIGKLFL